MWKRKRKRKKSKPKTREVYLMERVTQRELLTIILLRREIKIGIANDTDQRNKQVDSGIPGKVIIISSSNIPKASEVESYLHRKYRKYNFKPKGAKAGAGGTEFFRLTSSQVRDIENELKIKSGGVDRFNIYLICVFVGVFIAILLHLI